ncbi:FadR/GntR family transcriptional regulator [Sporosarcina limicola]|uniref:GntR family transcriptional repressor for pyruvate dehydrogenase complex n=1 Tax=Sporosarcina limicola TaxID=34101 RepID=A0A927ML77_9BACL|nr:FadR/GntR family transcriptional regulator [Sporosarcina limicola]MBE1555966.1 GntR family transcriptional repressor for pyruvate dehydrogenase complex [Sporosarcina limicola]
MEYKPIRTRKIYEEVTDSLLNLIKTGRLKPGDKLDSVEQLAKNFDVSRSAVREALSGLRAMGLLEMKHGEGTYITHFDASNFLLPVAAALVMERDDVKELSQVRKILEVGAAGLAAISHSEEDLLPMEQALQAMRDANGEGELGEKADLEFHLAIANATHNQMLINLMGSVSDIMVEAMREARKLIFHSEKGHANLLKEHQLIFDAIKGKQFNEAQNCMFNHLVEVENIVFNFIQQKSPT